MREAQKNLTRQRLLDAAAALFTDRGYHPVTIDDIATAAGTTRPTFYAHFTSKADVTRALWNEMVELPSRQLWDDVATIVSTIPTHPELLRAWLEQLMDYWWEEGPIIVALREASIIEPGIKERRDTARETITATMRHSMAAPTAMTDSERAIRALAAFELLTQIFDAWVGDVIPHERDSVIKTVLDAWTALLAPPAP
ncbi:TetR/AcrR family transcriptional regulator [Microbacterium sp. AGC85]